MIGVLLMGLSLIVSRDSGSCVRYDLQQFDGVGWHSVADTTIPSASLNDTLQVSIADTLNTYAVYKCSCVSASGDTGVGLTVLVIPASIWSDTLAFLNTDGIYRAIHIAASSLNASIRLTNVDTATLIHMETYQRKEAARIYELFGFYAPLAGGLRYVVP